MVEIIEAEWRIYGICVNKLTIIAWYNGLSPARYQSIIWTNGEILSIRTKVISFSEILNAICILLFEKMHFKMSSAKCRRSQCVNTVEQSLCRLDVRFGVKSGKAQQQAKFASRHMSVTPVCASVEVNVTSIIRIELLAFILFTLIFYLYHFIVSAVSVTSHNWMLYFNCCITIVWLEYILLCCICFIFILCSALENIAVRRYINQ